MSMKKATAALCAVLLSAALCSCAEQTDPDKLCDMQSVITDVGRAVVWEGRTYEPFCVVKKTDRGGQIGYVDGDTDDRISEYKDYPPEEWLVSWLPMDGGAMLLKEQGVTDIPDGLEAEYQ